PISNLLFSLLVLHHPSSTLFPYTTLFRSDPALASGHEVRPARPGRPSRLPARRLDVDGRHHQCARAPQPHARTSDRGPVGCRARDRKSTRLNSSHVEISYAVFCLKKKKPE